MGTALLLRRAQLPLSGSKWLPRCWTNKGIETQRVRLHRLQRRLPPLPSPPRTTADVIYVPTDNTAASNTEAIANVLVPAGVPAICGEEGICSGCGVATLSISYYDLGVTTGKMAAQILTGEADISTMPIEYTRRYPQVQSRHL